MMTNRKTALHGPGIDQGFDIIRLGNWTWVSCLVLFTRPDGLPVWIDTSQVQAVTAAVTAVRSCGPTCTMIALQGGIPQQFVRQPAAEVVERLRGCSEK